MRTLRIAVLPLALATASAVPASGSASGSEVPESFKSYPYLRLAGDLDGDGLADTISFGRTEATQEIGGIGSIGGRQGVLTARRGSDGAILWQHLGPEASEVIPAPLGPAGSAGVLLVEGPVAREWGGSIADGGGPPDVSVFPEARSGSLTLTALDGEGETLWTRAFERGALAGAGAGFQQELDRRTQVAAGARLPMFIGTFQATPSPALDLLVSIADRVDAGEASVTRIQAVIVDGATGAIARTIERLSTTRATIRTAGDASGDGLDDVAFLRVPTRGGISVARSSDGETLWENPADLIPGMYYHAIPMGDVTGDGLPELTVGGIDHIWHDDEGKSAVLDGATGRILVSGPGAGYSPAGDVDGDGDAEILSQQLTATPAPSLYADTVVYRLLSVEGEVLAEREYDGPTDDGMWIDLDPAAGDLRGDGATVDAAHRWSWQDDYDEPIRHQGFAIDARTLEPLFDAEAGAPVHASLDGEGDDLVIVRLTTPGTLTVTAQDGATGAPIWSRGLSVDPSYTGTWPGTEVTAADVDGDEVPDLIVNVALSKSEQTTFGSAGHAQIRAWAISGAGGAMLWTV